MNYLIALLAAGAFAMCIFSILEDKGASSKMMAILSALWAVSFTAASAYTFGEEAMQKDMNYAIASALPQDMQEDVANAFAFARSIGKHSD